MDVTVPYLFILVLLNIGGVASYVLGIFIAWTIHRYLEPFLRGFFK